MALETATYIDGLNASNPAASDAISTADDHLRLIKSTIKSTFPNITGPVTATQAAINGAAPLASPALTGTPTAPTASAGTNTTQIATTAFVRANGVPSGVIAMWSGTVTTIPSGWFLCNGSNGTPDLRDRFIIGARQDDSSVAKTNVTGSLTQTGGSKDAIAVSHTHTATSVVTDPGHFHNIEVEGSAGSNSFLPRDSSGTDSLYPTETATTGITVATTVASAGTSGTNANLPPYYALAFIMKA